MRASVFARACQLPPASPGAGRDTLSLRCGQPLVFGHGMWGSYVDLLKGLSLSVASRSRLFGPTFAGYDRILSGPQQAVLRAAWRSWIGMRYHTGMLSVQRLW